MLQFNAKKNAFTWKDLNKECNGFKMDLAKVAVTKSFFKTCQFPL